MRTTSRNFLSPSLSILLVPALLCFAGEFSKTKAFNREWFDDDEHDEAPSIAMDDMGNCVAVWQAWESPNDDNYNIFVSHSSDGGRTWSSKTALTQNDGALDEINLNQTPSIATDGHGTWLSVWQYLGPHQEANGSGFNVFAARSTDGGASWSRPKKVNTDRLTPSTREEPWIASDEHGNWMCVWIGAHEIDFDYFIGVYFSLSSDKGRTWSDPMLIGVNDFPEMPKVASSGNGNWMITWMHELDEGNAIAYSVSENNGTTWTTPKDLTSDADIVECLNYSIASDYAGKWMLVVDGASESSIDIYETHSTDNATTWSVPGRISVSNENGARSNEYPVVATNRMGSWIVMWQRFSGIWDNIVVIRESNEDFSAWGAIKPARHHDKPRFDYKWATALAANRSDRWIAVWEWTHPDAWDRDLCFATRDPSEKTP
ncbi:MAG: exo-alpha-sialidase [Candidatus Hydrogenedentes bacterium]|nr:exo-alpha-sialidase [Candidatus Hydrogenedentota bacterium]